MHAVPEYYQQLPNHFSVFFAIFLSRPIFQVGQINCRPGDWT